MGDDLLTHGIPVYQSMKVDHNNGKVVNYIEASYDTYFFDGDYRERNHLNMICNAFTKGLNQRAKLPHTVIILTSGKFFNKQETFLPSEADKKIRWIFKEFDHLIRSRKQDIPYKSHQGMRTRILWVQVLPVHADLWKLEAAKQRDRSPYPERLERFNKLLSKICMAKNHGFIEIRDIIDTDGKALSRYTGNPTDFGFDMIFKEITRTLKILDTRAREHEKDKILEEELKQLRLQTQRLDNKYHSQRNLSGGRTPPTERAAFRNAYDRRSHSPHRKYHDHARIRYDSYKYNNKRRF